MQTFLESSDKFFCFSHHLFPTVIFVAISFEFTHFFSGRELFRSRKNSMELREGEGGNLHFYAINKHKIFNLPVGILMLRQGLTNAVIRSPLPTKCFFFLWPSLSDTDAIRIIAPVPVYLATKLLYLTFYFVQKLT